MNENSSLIDFLIEGNRKGIGTANKENMSILGGRIQREYLSSILETWAAQMENPYCFWEMYGEVIFEKGMKTEQDIIEKAKETLIRFRMFSKEGDFELWRSTEKFHWRYIGNHLNNFPANNGIERKDFWENTTLPYLYQRECSALLWGKKDTDKNVWLDDRLAAVKLIYPGMSSERVCLTYIAYSYAGKLHFARYTGLKEWQRK